MSACKSTYSFKVGKTTVTLHCNLTEGHLTVYKRHYDKSVGPTGLEWVQGAQPLPVESTRTTPGRKSAVTSAALHTGQFEVVND